MLQMVYIVKEREWERERQVSCAYNFVEQFSAGKTNCTNLNKTKQFKCHLSWASLENGIAWHIWWWWWKWRERHRVSEWVRMESEWRRQVSQERESEWLQHWLKTLLSETHLKSLGFALGIPNKVTVTCTLLPKELVSNCVDN